LTNKEYKKWFIKSLFGAPILQQYIRDHLRDAKTDVALMKEIGQALIGTTQPHTGTPGQLLVYPIQHTTERIFVPPEPPRHEGVLFHPPLREPMIPIAILKVFLDVDVFELPHIPSKWEVEPGVKMKGKKHIYVMPYHFSVKKEYYDKFLKYLKRYKFI